MTFQIPSAGKLESGAYAVLTMLYFWLSLNLPVSLLSNARHDDALFMLNGIHLAQGKWLGDYSNLTLAKGPIFPIFLAINYCLGTPISLVISFFYCFACYVFVYALGCAGMPSILRFVLWAVLLFQPAAMSTRIIRDNIYISLTLLVLAAVIIIISNKNALRNSALGGLALSALWMTREEGLWIIPGVAVLFSGYLFLCIRGTFGKWPPKGTVLPAMAFMGCFLAPIQAVSLINYFQYGYYGITDMKGRHFKRALKSLQSVVLGDPVPFVPVPVNVRKEVYRHSPAFAELQGILESEKNSWRKAGKKYYPQTENDYIGGWFLWAFRDAVAKAGYYTSPMAAEDFYAKVAREIEAAQKQGLLPESSSPVPYMPPIARENLALIPAAFAKAFGVTTYHQIGVPVVMGPSTDNPNGQLEVFRKFLGYPKTVPSEADAGSMKIRGWYYSKAGDWPVLSISGNRAADSSLARLPSPDLVKHFKDPACAFNRFSFAANPESNQVLKSGAHSVPVRTLIAQKKGQIPLGSGIIYVDAVDKPIALLGGDLPQRAAIAAKRALLEAYHFAIPAIAYGGLACLVAIPCLIYFSRGRAVCNPLLLFAGLAFAVLYFSRVAILVAVDVTSFPAINSLYLGPAFAMVPAFAFSMFSIIFCMINNWKKRKI